MLYLFSSLTDVSQNTCPQLWCHQYRSGISSKSVHWAPTLAKQYPSFQIQHWQQSVFGQNVKPVFLNNQFQRLRSRTICLLYYTFHQHEIHKGWSFFLLVKGHSDCWHMGLLSSLSFVFEPDKILAFLLPLGKFPSSSRSFITLTQ